jgi:NTE family protein
VKRLKGEMYNLISKLKSNVRHVADFNQLPHSFLCIGTDIEKRERMLIVLKSEGNLAQALRSPFVIIFTSSEIDGRLIVDGGVTKQLSHR